MKGLEEVSIGQIFLTGESSVYEIPIYQRNYAWEREEVEALVKDIYDSYKNNSQKVYYIGTLVLYKKDENVFEIIDGQQRLTTIRLILSVLREMMKKNIEIKSQLKYRARKKSDDTLKHLLDLERLDEKDEGIVKGIENARDALKIVDESEINGYTDYFFDNVHIISYQVPKGIDLNHYFEVMNSRGEQLEMHEIVKASLMQKLLNDHERSVFNIVWQACSKMSSYVQLNFEGNATKVFSSNYNVLIPSDFDDISIQTDKEDVSGLISISEILNENTNIQLRDENDDMNLFQPIIDFPNFLLIVLKITLLKETDFDPIRFNLDDKELIREFEKAKFDCDKVKKFAYNLLKARFFLDNYIVHHSNFDDSYDTNPWNLQILHKDTDGRLSYKNLKQDQKKLVHLLSMFEVSFTARQRKNYLFYILLYLMSCEKIDIDDYENFAEKIADKYFFDIYLDKSKLNSINTPLPGSFDEVMVKDNTLNVNIMTVNTESNFSEIYGDGSIKSVGIPLFVFNYLDFKIWKFYADNLRGEELKSQSKERVDFFRVLGCEDFGLEIFDKFYFSRTRRSLEHFYPQASATGINGALNQDQINCFGNYAMIGSSINSSGSNWDPRTKLEHYMVDKSGKINKISVASLKFMIMMQICKSKNKWTFDEITFHQNKMVDLLTLPPFSPNLRP